MSMQQFDLEVGQNQGEGHTIVLLENLKPNRF